MLVAIPQRQTHIILAGNSPQELSMYTPKKAMDVFLVHIDCYNFKEEENMPWKQNTTRQTNINLSEGYN